MANQQIQKAHYNSIAEIYSDHYGDSWSNVYRRIFFLPFLKPLPGMENQIVLVAMCGSGEGMKSLTAPHNKLIGLDISENEISRLQKMIPGVHCIVGDVLNCSFVNASIDCVIIIGGLHHLHPSLNAGMQEIHRILKPGGKLKFVEPHAGSLPDLFRKLWYRFDRYFAPNEESVNMNSLKESNKLLFFFNEERYGGNLAYLLCFNSMIFRMPKWIKKFISASCILIEKGLAPLMKPWNSCYVIGSWEKK